MQPSPASLSATQGVMPHSMSPRTVLLVAGFLALLTLGLAGGAVGSLHRLSRGIQPQDPAASASLRHLAAILEGSAPPTALQGAPAGRDPAAGARELGQAIEAVSGHLAAYRAATTGAELDGIERATRRWTQAARSLATALAAEPRDDRAVARTTLALRVARDALAEAVEYRRRIDTLNGQSAALGLGERIETTVTVATGALVALILTTLGLLLCGLRLVRDGRQSREAVLFAGRRDALTQLPNRRALEVDLQQLVEACQRGQLALVKLERFTRVVHVYGPVFADRALVAAARRIATDLASLHGNDVRMYRLEGTTFALLLPELGRERARSLMHTVVRGFNAPLCLDDHDIFLDLRVGLVEYPDDSSSVDLLLSSAETALRVARDDGALPVRPFDPEMRASLHRRTELEEGLQRACSDDSLELHFHPQIEIATGRLVGLEALLRWQHPRLGAVSPAEFIPIAEETGAINDIGRWVLRRACAQLAVWRRLGHPGLRMSVNVSPLQLAGGELPDLVADVLRATGLPPDCLELEITEGFSLNDMDLMSSGLHALKAVGVRLAIDDFGTGYSSLSYLRLLPVDVLKIDRSFIRELQRDAKRYDLVRIVVDLGHALGHEVVAEGIEMADELRALQWLGCDLAQGYLTCRPLPAEALTPLLGRSTWLPEGILPTAVVRPRSRLGRPLQTPGRRRHTTPAPGDGGPHQEPT
jgi:diguanylate cyclase (GGDEF)-like protein